MNGADVLLNSELWWYVEYQRGDVLNLFGDCATRKWWAVWSNEALLQLRERPLTMALELVSYILTLRLPLNLDSPVSI